MSLFWIFVYLGSANSGGDVWDLRTRTHTLFSNRNAAVDRRCLGCRFLVHATRTSGWVGENPYRPTPRLGALSGESIRGADLYYPMYDSPDTGRRVGADWRLESARRASRPPYITDLRRRSDVRNPIIASIFDGETQRWSIGARLRPPSA